MMHLIILLYKCVILLSEALHCQNPENIRQHENILRPTSLIFYSVASDLNCTCQSLEHTCRAYTIGLEDLEEAGCINHQLLRAIFGESLT